MISGNSKQKVVLYRGNGQGPELPTGFNDLIWYPPSGLRHVFTWDSPFSSQRRLYQRLRREARWVVDDAEFNGSFDDTVLSNLPFTNDLIFISSIGSVNASLASRQ